MSGSGVDMRTMRTREVEDEAHADGGADPGGGAYDNAPCKQSTIIKRRRGRTALGWQ